LNLKSFPDRVPDGLADVMDEEKLGKARAYLVANSRFHIIESTASLVVLLVFWLSGGFGWLDQFARSVFHGEVSAGLLFLSLLLLGQTLLSLPFAIYGTFVIEQKFGFNRSTPAVFIMD